MVPRITTSFWHRLSRHVKEWAQISASALNLPPLLPIPAIVLYVAPHTLSMPSRSDPLDSSVDSALKREHLREAVALRGL